MFTLIALRTVKTSGEWIHDDHVIGSQCDVHVALQIFFNSTTRSRVELKNNRTIATPTRNINKFVEMKTIRLQFSKYCI